MGLDLDEDGEDYNEEDSGVESGFGRYGNITSSVVDPDFESKDPDPDPGV